MKTDYQVTKEILNILIGYNLKNIAIFSEKKHLLEEVDSLVKKIYMVRIPDLAFSEKIVNNLKSIKIGDVSFLSLSADDSIKGRQYDLDILISLISNLLKIHYYAYEWLRYLADKYHD